MRKVNCISATPIKNGINKQFETKFEITFPYKKNNTSFDYFLDY